MKWIKRLFVSLVVLVLVAAAAGAAVYHFYWRGTPDWYRRPVASAAEQAAAAARADDKIVETLSQVQEMQAGARAPRDPDPSDQRPAATQPVRPLTVTFTEDELNATFNKWDAAFGWRERMKGYLTEPAIVLHDGRIILAGTSPDAGTVVSAHFEPTLDGKGQLKLELDRLLAGRLPLPQGMFDKYRQQLGAKLKGALPGLQRKAGFRADGSANGEAVSAAMAKLCLQMLAGRPAEPVLFIPVTGGRDKSIPVRIEDVTIQDKSLSLTVKPLNAAERDALLARIREGVDEETAMGEPAGAEAESPSGS